MYNECKDEISYISSKSLNLYWSAIHINEHTQLLKIIGNFYDLLSELNELRIKYNDGNNLFRIIELSYIIRRNILDIKDKLNKTKSTTFTLEGDVNMMINTNMTQDNYQELLSLEYRINESLSIPLKNCITFDIDDYIKQTNQLNLYLYELNLIITKNPTIRFNYSQKISNLNEKIEIKLEQLKDIFQKYKHIQMTEKYLYPKSNWINDIAIRELSHKIHVKPKI